MDDNLRESLRREWNKYEESKADPVRVGLLGQPGAGKSSLINSIVGEDLAPVGVTTDYTTGPADYKYNEISLVDLPGYGTEGFPKEGFLERFDVLRFDALMCVVSGKFRSDDAEFFRAVRSLGKPCVFVRTHASSLHQRGKTSQELREDIASDLARLLGGADHTLVFVDNATLEGMNDLHDAIARMIAPARRNKYVRWAKGTSNGFLERKREACETMIRWYAAGSALNGLNPVPGAGVAVDLGLVTKMHADILKAFGFNQEILEGYFSKYEMLRPIIGPLLNSLLREGAALLARFVGRGASKWVPFVGPALAASAGLVIVYAAGRDFADRCLDLARRVRDAELAGEAAA